MPSRRATASRGGAVVAGQHDDARCRPRRSACSAAGVVALTGSAMAMMPAGLPSTATKIAVAPSARSRSASRVERGGRRCRVRRGSCALPSATRLPLDHADRALAGRRVEAAAPARARCLRSAAAATIAVRQRMLARALDAGGKPQHLGLVEALGRRRSRRPSACLRSACRSCRPPACRPSPCAPAPRRS